MSLIYYNILRNIVSVKTPAHNFQGRDDVATTQ